MNENRGENETHINGAGQVRCDPTATLGHRTNDDGKEFTWVNLNVEKLKYNLIY